MRGQVDPQSQMFSYFSPESRVPADHPLRGIKAHTERVLKELSSQFEALYATTGRPSIPPEQLRWPGRSSLMIVRQRRCC